MHNYKIAQGSRETSGGEGRRARKEAVPTLLNNLHCRNNGILSCAVKAGTKRKAGDNDALLLNLVSVDAVTNEVGDNRTRIGRFMQDGDEAISNLLPN